MSSTSSRKPEFRLLFGYPSITLVEQGRSEPVAEVDLAGPALATRLHALGGTVARAGARLTVVLPESEVWRGSIELRGATPLARRAEARGAAAARMAAAPGDLAAVLGPRDASGRTPVVAVRRSTLAETRGFLRRAGLRPAAIVGAGAFPGFAAPPRLTPPIWRDVTRSAPPRTRLAIGAVAASAVFLALTFLLGAGEPETTLAAAPDTLAPALAAPVAPLVVASVETAPVAAPLASTVAVPVVAIAPPRHAPSPRLVAEVAPKAPAPLGPVVTQGTRDMPELAGLKPTDDLSADRIAARILPVPAPPRRPGSAAPVASFDAAGRPAPRPPQASVATVTPKALATRPAPVADGLRPRARPLGAPPAALSAAITGAVNKATAEPVRVASLSTATDAAALVAATVAATTVAAPEPRPVRAAAIQPVKAQPVTVRVKPKPAVLATRAPLAEKPTPITAKPVPIAAKPVPVTTVPTRTVTTKAVPVKPVATRAPVMAPAPKVVAQRPAAPTVRQASLAPAKTAPQKQMVAARPTVEKAGLSRGSVSLLGVFGAEGERHALVRLPNGKVKRVRAGDNLSGVQVASVGADTVRLTGGGRDTLLKLAE